MLDKISLKLIKLLREDGRCSNVELAQKTGISAATVAKKVDTMIEEGVIVIKAIQNPPKMGYQTQAFIGLYVELNKVDNVFNLLKENINIPTVVTSFGRLNILFLVMFRNWIMFQNFIKELSQLEGIINIETSIIQADMGGESIKYKTIPIDELDEKLIRELIRNGRASYADIGNKLGISKTTVSRRVAFLLKEGLVKIVAIPYPPTLGYSVSALIGVRVQLTKIEKILDEISNIPEIVWNFRLINNYDLLLGIHFTNTNALDDFLRSKIAKIDGITSVETFICGSHQFAMKDRPPF